MTGLETVLLGTGSGLLAVVMAGAAAYLKFARTILTRSEHNEECSRRTQPIHNDIADIKRRIEKVDDRLDTSTRDLSKQIQEVLREVKRNGMGRAS